MKRTLYTMAGAAILVAGISSLALAQYQSYQPGYAQPGYGQPAYGQPAYGANPYRPTCGGWGQPACQTQNQATGGAAGAAMGGAIGGSTGAAIGAAAGQAMGTNADRQQGIPPAQPVYGTSYPPPASGCAPGYYWANGGCYPR